MKAKASIGTLERAKAITVYNATTKALEALSKYSNIYPTPSPDLGVMKASNEALRVAINEFDNAGGGKVLGAVMEARRLELVSLMQQLALYVTATANGDKEKLVCGGFPIQKTREPVGKIPALETPVVAQGKKSGEARATVKRPRGAYSFEWRVALAASPTVYVYTTSTTAARDEFDGLTPGELYRFEVRALGAAGPSDYSNAATFRVV